MVDDVDDPMAWATLADAALNRLLVLHRLSRLDPTADDDRRDPGHAAGAADLLASVEQSYAEARAHFFDALAETDSGFAALATNARLSSIECELLALVMACELDTRRQGLVDVLQDNTSTGRLMLQTAGWALGGLDLCAAAVGPNSGLRRAALIDVAGDGPWAQRTIVAPMALVWAFLGDTAADPDLPWGVRFVDRDDLPEARSTGAGERDGDDVPLLVIAYGPDRVRRREAAMTALSGQRFLVTTAPDSEAGWDAVVREATMTGRAVIVELEGALGVLGRRRIDHATHLAIACTAKHELLIDDLPDRPAREIEAPASEMSDEEWLARFGDSPRIHRLTPQQAEQAHKIYGARGNDIDASVRRLLAGPLESLAVRIRPRSNWDDLVLSPNRAAQLRAVISRYRSSAQVFDKWGFSATPSRGLVALFSGPSGTGKTLAAEVVAGELGLDMFRLDLSSVVSKYIGETEKNLDQVFDAAGVGNVVLFFDEADSLFGKRSEVRDSRDRYTNVEVSYLLQRVEAFDGVVVLATNFEKSIDGAFLRRIHSRIDFVLPEEAERLAIWRRHLPAATLLDDVDLEWLAERFEFSGGQIRNAAVHAAFLAAGSGVNIGMHELVLGAAQEFRKSGRLIRQDTFGDWHSIVAD